MSKKLFLKVELKALQWKRWFGKLYLFYKILRSKPSSYLFNLITENNNPHASRSALNNQIHFLSVKTVFFNLFFPAVITEWNNPHISIRNSSSCHIFKNLIGLNLQNLEGLKLLTRTRLRLSHLADHKFRHLMIA